MNKLNLRGSVRAFVCCGLDFTDIRGGGDSAAHA